jgi:hypothetical protein
MAAGDQILDASGDELLDGNGDEQIDETGDPCGCCVPACETCVEDTEATVTLSGGESCFTCDAGRGLVGALSGTFTLTYDPLSPGDCRYTYIGPYTGIVVTVYEELDCTGAILAQTDEINVILFFNTVTGKWDLVASVAVSGSGILYDIYGGSFTPAPGEFCLEDAGFIASDACNEIDPASGTSAWIGGTAIATIAP